MAWHFYYQVHGIFSMNGHMSFLLSIPWLFKGMACLLLIWWLFIIVSLTFLFLRMALWCLIKFNCLWLILDFLRYHCGFELKSVRCYNIPIPGPQVHEPKVSIPANQLSNNVILYNSRGNIWSSWTEPFYYSFMLN